MTYCVETALLDIKAGGRMIIFLPCTIYDLLNPNNLKKTISCSLSVCFINGRRVITLVVKFLITLKV